MKINQLDLKHPCYDLRDYADAYISIRVQLQLMEMLQEIDKIDLLY